MDALLSPDVLPWLLAAAVGVLAVAGLLLLRARDGRAAAREREEARADAARLREQLAALEEKLARPSDPPTPRPSERSERYVITRLGQEPEQVPAVAERIDGRLFADIVARETLVKAASWTHGLRRALAPESRNRIRFHMRQELKRARKERRAEVRQALREFRARRRAEDEDAA